jgi:hypothetical protein
VLVGRNVHAHVAGDDVLTLLMLLNHVKHAVVVAEEHLAALLALEA